LILPLARRPTQGPRILSVRFSLWCITIERVASPGAYLVDILPSLIYLPFFPASFKREAARLHPDELDLFAHGRGT